MQIKVPISIIHVPRWPMPVIICNLYKLSSIGRVVADSDFGLSTKKWGICLVMSWKFVDKKCRRLLNITDLALNISIKPVSLASAF